MPSELTDHHSSLITRAAIVGAARSFLGVPFHHQGRNPLIGLDCRGLLFAICGALGHQLRHQHRDNYAREPDPQEFRAALASELEEIALAEALPADVLLIRFPRQTPEQATHAGVLAAGPYEPMLIHACAGWVVEEPLRRWQPYLVAAFRFPGVSDG